MVESAKTELSIVTQCALLQINRSTYYYQDYKKPEVSEEDLLIMHEIDKVYTEFPVYGARRMSRELKRRNWQVGRQRATKLMRIMGLEPIYPRPNTSKPHPGHQTYPYLLKGVKAGYPNHIWGVDITYIPLQNTWMYLVAILDWYSRYIVSWELADTMTVDFCIRALQTALEKAIPDIHNSDQGSQFTSQSYLSILEAIEKIAISMDGRGRAFDNIFTERLWRTVKQEEVYLNEYQSPKEARESLTEFIYKYNYRRLHQSIDYVPPAEVYFGDRKLKTQ